jgi:hypothetical protein
MDLVEPVRRTEALELSLSTALGDAESVKRRCRRETWQEALAIAIAMVAPNARIAPRLASWTSEKVLTVHCGAVRRPLRMALRPMRFAGFRAVASVSPTARSSSEKFGDPRKID